MRRRSFANAGRWIHPDGISRLAYVAPVHSGAITPNATMAARRNLHRASTSCAHETVPTDHARIELGAVSTARPCAAAASRSAPYCDGARPPGSLLLVNPRRSLRAAGRARRSVDGRPLPDGPLQLNGSVEFAQAPDEPRCGRSGPPLPLWRIDGQTVLRRFTCTREVSLGLR
jgi:hypothetical protein